MRSTPSDEDAGRRAALALHRSGKLADAARLYGELLKQEPRDAELLGLSGLAEFQLGHEEQALAYAQGRQYHLYCGGS